jgi:hypothetical protein
MPCRPDAAATAAFQRMVNADYDGAGRHESGHDRPQKCAGEREAGPGVSVEHAVKSSEAGVLGQAQGAQAVGDSARSNRQQRAHGQSRNGRARPPREDCQVGREPGEEAGR